MKESDPRTGWAGAGNRGPAAAFGLLCVAGALGGSRCNPGPDSGHPAGSHLLRPRRSESSRSHLNLLEREPSGEREFSFGIEQSPRPSPSPPADPLGQAQKRRVREVCLSRAQKIEKKSLRPFSRLRNVHSPLAPGGKEATPMQGSRCRRWG